MCRLAGFSLQAMAFFFIVPRLNLVRYSRSTQVCIWFCLLPLEPNVHPITLIFTWCIAANLLPRHKTKKQHHKNVIVDVVNRLIVNACWVTKIHGQSVFLYPVASSYFQVSSCCSHINSHNQVRGHALVYSYVNTNTHHML